ncbi:hypothetical protein [Knoellia subterranea]|uniref:Uncharacterized protein n=1 Tax=Knoellia subterranea KCTC 19937 TaxID=1385521 RepID=A0A0A0JL85_9MICO|nr:hypothetical protein [Knoellia subterranea]KGN37878.1 hypothetical protein N803_12520 [Knoellia subterranea KCTC 19937]
MAEYTDAERDTIRTAAFGAIALVSKADPGFFSSFKESLAGSKALASGPKEITEILRSGGFPTPPTGDAAAQEQAVTSGLTQAVSILNAKADGSAEAFKGVILEAAQAVADASDGVAPEEQAVLDKVKAALG